MKSMIANVVACAGLMAASEMVAAAGKASRASQTGKSYAIIVANNRSLDEADAPLEYADDDGAKFHELFSAAGARAVLLTAFSQDTASRFPDQALIARPPTHKALLTAVEETFAAARADRAQGAAVTFYFVFVGYGGMGSNRQGYVHLQDARLTREELMRQIIARSPADRNHLVVDVCHAYYVVHKRDDKPDKAQRLGATLSDFFAAEELQAYPSTGVILASSSESENHEWSRWRAGLFSHELRSALLGAADLNRDDLVSYGEAVACVEAANANISEPEHRLHVSYRPPGGQPDAALFRRADLGKTPRLDFDSVEPGRWHVEDARGVRVADLRPSPLESVRISLLGSAPFFVRSDSQEAVIEKPSAEAALKELPLAQLSAVNRGSAEVSFFRHLYTVPFDAGFLRGAMAFREQAQGDTQIEGLPATGIADASPGSVLRPLGWIGLGVGAAAALAGGACLIASTQTNDASLATDNEAEARSLHNRTERLRGAGGALIGVGAGLAMAGVTALVVAAVRSPRTKDKTSSAPVAVTTAPGGLGLGLSGAF